MGEWGKSYSKVKTMKEQGYNYKYYRKKLCIYDKEDNLINMFDNGKQASEFIGIKHCSLLSAICRGQGLGKKHYKAEWVIVKLDREEVDSKAKMRKIRRGINA
jgi:hypothetical protein